MGLDRALLEPDRLTEVQARQLLYARELPAELIHLVKARPRTRREPILLEGGSVQIVPVPSPHWIAFSLLAVRAGTRILRRSGADIVQAQDPFLSGLAGLILARRFRLPLIVGAFSDEVDNPVWVRRRWANRIANAIGRIVHRQATAIRADSQAVTERLRRGGFSQARFIPFLITNADKFKRRDSTAARVREELLGGTEGPLLLAAARLEPEKNIALMLRAVSAVRQVHRGLILAIAGDGSLRKELKRLAGAILPGGVKWLGWIPNDEIAVAYQAADLVLVSSDYESSARVLTEALLAGTPVLTTDTSGAREVIEDGIYGRVVPVGDEASFGAALAQLVAPGVDLRRMGERGSASAARRVEPSAIISELREMYRLAAALPRYEDGQVSSDRWTSSGWGTHVR